MEIIHLSGYTEDEKFNIAIKYLVPKALKDNGLKAEEVTLEDDALLEVIRRYTREAGVRHLQREISKIFRKVVKEILQSKTVKTVVITKDNLEDYLGVYRFQYGIAEETDQVGQVTGLALSLIHI